MYSLCVELTIVQDLCFVREPVNEDSKDLPIVKYQPQISVPRLLTEIPNLINKPYDS